MRKILLSLAVAFGMQAGAQTIDTIVTIDTTTTIDTVTTVDTVMLVNKTDSTVVSIPISEIDSMTFDNDTTTNYNIITTYDTTVVYDTIWSSNSGHVLLPGNVTCDTMYISVTGCGGDTSIVYNGYTYGLVEIGGQCWFDENLRTTTYRDGSAINYPDTNNTVWMNDSTGAYAWYDNDSTTYDSIYGKLYNWDAVDNSAGLCPTGWHVPTDCEWMYLEGSVGMSINNQEKIGKRGTDEGGKLKETGTIHWKSPNTGATNSSGFSGLGGGRRTSSGFYAYIRDQGDFWTSTITSTSFAWYRILSYFENRITRNYFYHRYAFSVRCIRD